MVLHGDGNLTTRISGTGGLGISINITGSGITYGSGGSGGIYNDRTNSGAAQAIPGSVDSGGGTGAYTINNTSVAGSIPYSKDGGSGIVIIRYRRIPTTSSVIELIRGTTTDSKTDYRLGNYDGSFKVKLAVNNYGADVLSVGEVGGIVSFPFGITTPLNVSVATLNNIKPSDWLRKSECVLILEATTRTQSGSVWTSVFHIPVNTIRSYYPSPQVNWRLRIAFSTADTFSTFVYGFFSAVYDQYVNFFTYFIDLGSGGVTISQNWDGSGGNRCVITISNNNSPRYLNINIA